MSRLDNYIESVINKVIPGLIPTFDVALANKFDPKRADWNDVWLASRKLDGVRCITIVDIQGNVKCYSRQGNEFETLDVVREAVKQMGLRGVVFDGEICLMDKDGNEDFPGIMKQIKRKNHTIDNPRYVMFDYLTLSEFDNKSSEMPLTDRLGRFAKVTFQLLSSKYLSVLQQVVVADDDHFAKLSSEAEELGHEGLMVNGIELKRIIPLNWDDPWKNMRRSRETIQAVKVNLYSKLIFQGQNVLKEKNLSSKNQSLSRNGVNQWRLYL